MDFFPRNYGEGIALSFLPAVPWAVSAPVGFPAALTSAAVCRWWNRHRLRPERAWGERATLCYTDRLESECCISKASRMLLKLASSLFVHLRCWFLNRLYLGLNLSAVLMCSGRETSDACSCPMHSQCSSLIRSPVSGMCSRASVLPLNISSFLGACFYHQQINKLLDWLS